MDRDAVGSTPLWLRFHDLMPYRVREILLVSSPYDFFILEEDGRLTERIFTEYSELNLSAAPRITHAPTSAEALRMLAERRFDLVMTMTRLEDADVGAFGQRVKHLDPTMPVVLLALTEADLRHVPAAADTSDLDRVFLWTGDSQILLAIIKLVEDRMNVEPDTRVGDVRVILVVEDSIRSYSHLLSVLYSELMAQSQSLITEGVNDLQRIARMRARPKLLLACSYEEAAILHRRHRDNLLAVLTDIRFPRGGQEDARAGIDLVRAIRADDAQIPVVLQSAEPADAKLAEELNAVYLDKNDGLLRQIRRFMSLNVGFGDFVFRTPDGAELARATSMFEMEQVLVDLPSESLEYHASRNHISLWLMARSMFQLARDVRAWTMTDFGGIKGTRQRLLAALRQARRVEQEGVIADFSPSRTDTDPALVRLGTGSIGGKGRGIAFTHLLLARAGIADRFPGLDIRAPRSVVVGTDSFDRFIESNQLHDAVRGADDDSAIVQRFLEGRLPDDLVRDLETVHRSLDGPLAVRSSSLLEDAHYQPFAGVYDTYMLPNNHPDAAVRLAELCRAIKAVYASTYCRNAQSYVARTPNSLEGEKMGIVIQRMVGRHRGARFYPTISGVALSWNYYPIGSQRAADGVALVALGLGQAIVEGEVVLQFSPGAPTVLPQFSTPREIASRSQSSFLALDMSRPTVDFLAGPNSMLSRHGLDVAEDDDSLWPVGSVYVAGEGRIRDKLDIPGPRVVTFHNILKWRAIPLADALAELLAVFGRGMGCAVELEFAVEMGDFGRHVPRGREPTPPCLNVLQIRPQGGAQQHEALSVDAFAPGELLCSTEQSLGHGSVDGIRDVVFVTRNDLGHDETPPAAAEVGRINATLVAQDRPYLLIGPGRWGSSDPGLGIPVSWSQISGVRVIVEDSLEGRAVDASQGTHFFHNVISFEIGYLSLGHGGGAAGHTFLDLDWLRAQAAVSESCSVRHVRLAEPLRVYLDGREGRATILKPAETSA